ncbi:MAG: nicotinate-nicotinamide nucleotide adenylyltransferase [Deltaproteobacteria bacterium]|nr:nicotinate-nicotinamide nucleotide adenylyltransferase [Deltaproteobacteria bacterium]
MASTMRIGILGGAFDPVHVGHVAMVDYVRQTGAVDQVRVIPCYRHAFAKPMAPYHHRLAMLRAAFAEGAGVMISEIERELGGVSYTARTLRTLMEQQPGGHFRLLIGADLLSEVRTWHEGAWLAQHGDWLVIPRGPAGPIPDVSSTQIRDAVRAGTSLDALVPATVAEYIAQHHLYGHQ